MSAVEGGGDYERGVAAGDIAARLAGHDKHFAAINGHLADLAQRAEAQALTLSRLTEIAEREAETRRNRDAKTPTLLQLVMLVGTALVSFAAFTAWLILVFGR